MVCMGVMEIEPYIEKADLKSWQWTAGVSDATNDIVWWFGVVEWLINLICKFTGFGQWLD